MSSVAGRQGTWAPPKNKGGRPSSWHVGKTPANLGQDAEPYDKDGLFGSELKLKDEWSTYLVQHQVGTTERKWDKQMTAEVKSRTKSLLKKQDERTKLSVEIHDADQQDHAANQRIASLKSAHDHYLENKTSTFNAEPLIFSPAPKALSTPELAKFLTRGESTQQDTDDFCDDMKNLCRRFLLEKDMAARKTSRKQSVSAFKLLVADIKTLTDDINYLINKMRQCAYEYARTEDQVSQTIKFSNSSDEDVPDDDYELPNVKSAVLVGLPSNNRLRRRDTVPAPVDVSDTVSSAATTASTSSTRSAEERSAEEEEPAAKRPHVDRTPTSTASTFRSWGFGS